MAYVLIYKYRKFKYVWNEWNMNYVKINNNLNKQRD